MLDLRSYVCMGLELAPLTVDWGQLEEVKDMLLATTQLFCAEHTLVVSNVDGRFSPNNPASIFYGRNLQLLPVTLALNGIIVYQGFIRSITVNHTARTASIVTQNAFTVAANYFVNLTTSGNPAAIVQEILEQAGLGPFLDPVSFTAAQGGFAVAGATIGVAYVTTGAVNTQAGISGTTALAAIQAICSLCGLSCYVNAGLVRLKAFAPYQGNFSGVKWRITPPQSYEFGSLEFAFSNLSNSVNIGYGASSNYYASNQASIDANNRVPGGKTAEVNTQFDCVAGNTLSVPNLISAQYFAAQFLARAATLRQQGSLTAGPELSTAQIGDRCTIQAPNWGPAPIPFEIIETHRKVQSQSTELVVATI